jgi:hypothetical protein
MQFWVLTPIFICKRHRKPSLALTVMFCCDATFCKNLLPPTPRNETTFLSFPAHSLVTVLATLNWLPSVSWK